ncbi:MAG: hypothetical protein C0623_01495 [Desulfuromonas sp.]|nr:MAG: hypothetical protein C0623_01495 [Desulfuromonas sp.]
MIRIKPGEITIFLLIAVLLMTGVAGAYGFALCDHGSLSATHHQSHHQGEASDKADPLPYYPCGEKHQDGCHDYWLHLEDASLEEKKDHDLVGDDVSFPVLTLPVFPEISNPQFATAQKFAIPELSQRLLIHRTIVLIV